MLFKLAMVFLLAILFYHISPFFFLTIDLYCLILAVNTQIFILIEELAIPTGIPTKEAKLEIKTHPTTVEAKISKCSV